MDTKVFLVSALTFVFANSCAASNGGGHGVGNSMIPDGTSKKVAEEKLCDCSAKKPAKDCDCSKAKEEKPAEEKAPAPTPAPAPAKKK